LSLFVDGTDLDYEFPTSKGKVGAMAEVVISGSTLELRHVAVFAGTGRHLDVGVREILEIARVIESLRHSMVFSGC
jgi:GH18 family chitinase